MKSRRSIDFYSGGLELLFSNQRKHQLLLPHNDGDGHPANLAFLIDYLCAKVMQDARKDMFVTNGTM